MAKKTSSELQSYIDKLTKALDDGMPVVKGDLDDALSMLISEDNPGVLGLIKLLESKYYYESNAKIDILPLLHESIKLMVGSKYESYAARSYHLLGQLSSNSGNYIIAIDYFNHALEYTKSYELDLLSAYVMFDIAIIHQSLNDFDKARKWYKKSLSCYSQKRFKNSDVITKYMTTLASYGFCLVQSSKMTSAEKCYDALSDMENGSHSEDFPKFEAYTFFASFHYNQDDVDNAYYFARNAKEALLESSDIRNSLDFVWNLLDILIKIEEYDEMLSALAYIMDFSKSKGFDDLLIQAVDYQLRYCSAYMSDDEYLDVSKYYFSLKQQNIANDYSSMIYMIDMQSQIADIEDNRRKLAEQNVLLSYQAEHDGLSNLLNRGSFNTRSPIACSEAAEDRKSFAILFIDIDYFKQMNDIYGHIQGDNCIKTIAKCISDSVPEGCAFRYGGDEFVVMLSGMSLDEVEGVEGKIVQSVLDQRIEHKGNKDRGLLSVTVGGAFGYPTRTKTLSHFLAKADESVYIQKESIRGGYNLLEF